MSRPPVRACASPSRLAEPFLAPKERHVYAAHAVLWGVSEEREQLCWVVLLDPWYETACLGWNFDWDWDRTSFGLPNGSNTPFAKAPVQMYSTTTPPRLREKLRFCIMCLPQHLNCRTTSSYRCLAEPLGKSFFPCDVHKHVGWCQWLVRYNQN